MAKTSVALTFLVLTFTCVSDLFAQLTLPEQAARLNQPITRTRTRELVSMPLEKVVEQSDLVVHGTLHLLRTYLSEDKMELYTDYEVEPLRVLAVRTKVAGSREPGRQPIVVRQWGGRMDIGGVPVEMIDSNLPLLPAEEQAILCLRYDSRGSKYEIVGVAGAFVVEKDAVRPHMHPPLDLERFRGMSVAAFVQEISRANATHH
jgi:hypothetical protein